MDSRDRTCPFKSTLGGSEYFGDSAGAGRFGSADCLEDDIGGDAGCGRASPHEWNGGGSELRTVPPHFFDDVG